MSNKKNSKDENGFKASVDRYICISLDEKSTQDLVNTVKDLPGTPIKQLHVTIVHSLDASKNEDAMEMWNKAIKLVDNEETLTVVRYKQAPGRLTTAEALLSVDLAALVASKVPHISLRLEKGHKAVESREVIKDDTVDWTNLAVPIKVKGVIKLMGRQ